MDILFRSATEEDVPLILEFILELAEYEKMANQVTANANALRKSLFGSKSYAEVVFATVSGREVGFVLFFHNFSTFIGKPGIYIEDLYVIPEFRGLGIGKAILSYMSKIALERDCGRIEWWVLDWNPAQKLYKSIGAKAMDEWVVYRLTGDDLDRLASEKNRELTVDNT